MVVECDEERQGCEAHAQEQAKLARSRIGEGSITHQTGCVYHIQFVYKLHWICAFPIRIRTQAPEPALASGLDIHFKVA